MRCLWKKRIIDAITLAVNDFYFTLFLCHLLSTWTCGSLTLARNYNPGQNIWHKVQKSSKIGQDFKSLLHNFACFLTAIVKFIFWKEDWTASPPKVDIFVIFPKSFAERELWCTNINISGEQHYFCLCWKFIHSKSKITF